MKYITGLIFLFLVTGCDNSYHTELLKSLFGKEIDYSIECDFEELSAAGEGFYMCVYNLDEEDIDGIKENLAAFPQLPEYRKDWQVLKWKKTPLANEDLPLYVRCMMSDKPIRCFDFFNHNDMQGQGNYYAAFYRDKKNDPHHADLFILVPAKGQLVFISKKI